MACRPHSVPVTETRLSHLSLGQVPQPERSTLQTITAHHTCLPTRQAFRNNISWVWQCLPFITVLRRQRHRQGDVCELKVWSTE